MLKTVHFPASLVNRRPSGDQGCVGGWVGYSNAIRKQVSSSPTTTLTCLLVYSVYYGHPSICVASIARKVLNQQGLTWNETVSDTKWGSLKLSSLDIWSNLKRSTLVIPAASYWHPIGIVKLMDFMLNSSSLYFGQSMDVTHFRLFLLQRNNFNLSTFPKLTLTELAKEFVLIGQVFLGFCHYTIRITQFYWFLLVFSGFCTIQSI